MTQARDLAADAYRSVAGSDPRELLGRFLDDPPLDDGVVDDICRDLIRAYQRGVHSAWFDHGMGFLEQRLKSNARIAEFFAFKVPSSISKLRSSRRFSGEQLSAIIHCFPEFTLPSKDQQVLDGLAHTVAELEARGPSAGPGKTKKPITPSEVALVLATAASDEWPEALESRDLRTARDVAHSIIAHAPIKTSEPCRTWTPEQQVRFLQGLHNEYADPVTVAAGIVLEEVQP